MLLQQLKQFLEMGGFAFYVWTSYVIVLAVLTMHLLLTLKQKKNLHKQIIQQKKAQN